MTCPRCAGLIVAEYLLNPVDGPPFGFPCRRCLNCGSIEDEVIVSNRVAPLPLRKSGSARHHRLPVVHSDQEHLVGV
jgi:hypothetical protein